MQNHNLTVECSIPILKTDLHFSTNDSVDVSIAATDNLHAQLCAWIREQATNPFNHSERKTSLACTANYKVGDENMTTCIEGEFTLKDQFRPHEQAYAIAAADCLHEKIIAWVTGCATKQTTDPTII
jgi:hypothetical protein